MTTKADGTTDVFAYVLHRLIDKAAFSSGKEVGDLHALLDGDASLDTDEAGTTTVVLGKTAAEEKADADEAKADAKEKAGAKA